MPISPLVSEADAAQRAIQRLHSARDPEPLPVIQSVRLIEGRIYCVSATMFRYTEERSHDMIVLISQDGEYERNIFDGGLPYPLDQLQEIDQIISRSLGFDPVNDSIYGYLRKSPTQTVVTTVPQDRTRKSWNKEFTVTLSGSRLVVSETYSEY